MTLNGKCPLSAYQLAVLNWAARGKRNAQIASIMGNTTEDAIKQHMWRIYNALGVDNRTGAVMVAIQHGWIAATQAAAA